MITVYYLDDEPALCRIFQRLYASDAVEVVVFTDPREAIEAYRKRPPDAFFIDYRLPGTSGEDVARLFEDDVPKILVSGDLQVETEYPFHRVLTKPHKAADVRSLLSELARRGDPSS